METCEWKENSNEYEITWKTSCGEEFVLLEGTPEENGLKFCAYCGRKLTQRAADELPCSFDHEALAKDGIDACPECEQDTAIRR